tara:strand:- start:397 stop:702 length:306 start_codon:yes stop_codon:yes gene_type:complete
MKKLPVILLILSLILFTAIIKNSTKRIDDEIFAIKESNRILKKEFENIKLENDYLSSAERLLKFQKSHFSDELIPKNINEFKIINEVSNELIIKKLTFINE